MPEKSRQVHDPPIILPFPTIPTPRKTDANSDTEFLEGRLDNMLHSFPAFPTTFKGMKTIGRTKLYSFSFGFHR